MKKYLKSPVYYIFLAALALLFAGCSSTRMEFSKRTTGNLRDSIRNVLVVGIMSPDYQQFREEMEKNISSDLLSKGIKATPAYVYGTNGLNGLSVTQMNQLVKKQGFNSVLIINMVKWKETHTDNANQNNQQNYSYEPQKDLNKYFLIVAEDKKISSYSSEGYVKPNFAHRYTNSKFFLQVELFSIGTGELIYTGKTNSYEYRKRLPHAKKIAKVIVGDIDR